ncbi:SH3 domain protein [Ostertagia ostertagi]
MSETVHEVEESMDNESEIDAGHSAGIGPMGFQAELSEELSFKKGDYLSIVGKGYPGWCIARNSLGQRGLIPENYTKPVIDIMEHQHSEIEEMTEEIETLYHRLHKAQEEIGTLLRGGPTDSDVTNDTETGRLRFYQEF